VFGPMWPYSAIDPFLSAQAARLMTREEFDDGYGDCYRSFEELER